MAKVVLGGTIIIQGTKKIDRCEVEQLVEGKGPRPTTHRDAEEHHDHELSVFFMILYHIVLYHVVANVVLH